MPSKTHNSPGRDKPGLIPLKLAWLERLAKHRDLTNAQVRVLLALASYANQFGSDARPGPARIARETGLGLSTVKEALSVATRLGLTRQTYRGGHSDGDASVYALTPWWDTPPVYWAGRGPVRGAGRAPVRGAGHHPCTYPCTYP